MKKGIIIICVLSAIILLEIFALFKKSENPEPVKFALDSQEYDLPVHSKIAPLPFETDFVEQIDAQADAIINEFDNDFGIHLAQIFDRLALEQQKITEKKVAQQQKFDEFRQTMAADPVNVRGVYLGSNWCEVDGVKGVCANGVYKLGKYCIACFEGFCAGTACNDEGKKVEENIAAHEVDELDESLKTRASEIVPETSIERVETEPEEKINDEIVSNEISNNKISDIENEPNQKIAPISETESMVAIATGDADLASEVQKKVSEKENTAEKAVKTAEKENKVLVAVVIDDIGLSVPFTNQIANIKYPLTVSFLPYGASDKAQVKKLKSAGFEVMLHAPMMPRVPADLAPVTLSPKMSKDEIQEKLLKMMDRFEGTGMRGINNHMGSAFTENREAMAAVMEVLQEHGMYFLDSKTTSRSVGRAISKEYGVPYVARDVFLDNERRYDYIMGQFKATERVAKSKGYAIAIGHPYPQTLQALKDWLIDSEKRGIKIVPLSDLVSKNN
ncbi:MAG: divergent polysaccharide deacetylase family protein [Alphaproteobacteria bacterium]|nr:divergent polysaccharide deacetylase family protein [Alphaproteobacteria bacterium]